MANKAPRVQSPLGYNGWCLIGLAFEWKSSSPPPMCRCAGKYSIQVDGISFSSCSLWFSSLLSCFFQLLLKKQIKKKTLYILHCFYGLCAGPNDSVFGAVTKKCKFWKGLMLWGLTGTGSFPPYANSEKSGSRLVVVSQRIKMKRA